MNSPYMGDFKVTQAFKGLEHDGLDLVGLDSKEIHATATGEIVFAGWENPSEHSQGFGQYVVIKSGGYYYHYGHLSQILVKVGQNVKCTDVIGIEGSTGNSTGSHCHYCIRTSMQRGTFVNVCNISGIPNNEGKIYNDGYNPAQAHALSAQAHALSEAKVIDAILEIDGHKYSGMLTEN